MPVPMGIAQVSFRLSCKGLNVTVADLKLLLPSVICMLEIYMWCKLLN